MTFTFELSPETITVLSVWGIVLLFTLAHPLERADLDPVTRLTWVLVLLLVPLFGIALYFALGNRAPRLDGRADSEVYGTPWASDPTPADSSGDQRGTSA
jgi:hypothetical protein